jgi:hypothetical protein
LAATIDDQVLKYSVSYGSKKVGTIEINIRNENGGYVVTSTSKPGAMAKMFMKDHVSDTRFIQHEDKVVLDSGTEQLKGKDGYDRGFQFDRGQGRIEFSNGKHADIKPDDEFEAVTFPLLLMLQPVESIKEGSQLREVSAKRIRNYTYENPVEETVKVPAGEFSSWKIVRHRSDRPEDSVTVWLEKSANPVPLQIAINKKGSTSTLKLTGK